MRTRLTAGLIATVVVSLSLAAAQAPATPSGDVTAQARAFVELLQQQQFSGAEALFTDQMKAALPEDKLKTTWSMLVVQVGAFKQQRAARMEVAGVMRRAIVTCDFERAALDFVVSYNPAGLIGGFNIRPYTPPTAPWAPPAYADPARYIESDVTVGGPDWPLPGTLTMPNGPGPFAAVVLVHGSGAGDRDESIGPNKTFKDLALGLASRGIAVLRYDKRKRVFPAKAAAVPNHTVKDETIDDALVAVAMLRTTPKINPSRIVVIGHSLGGMLIPRVGLADSGVAGLIAMAGATGFLPEVIVRQYHYLLEADGRITPDEQALIDGAEIALKKINALTSADAADRLLIDGEPASYWLDLRGYDPPTVARSVKQPLLILQGERDYQVTMVDDFAKWKLALDGKAGVTFHTYPALNHLFLPGTGKSLPAEYDVPGHVPVDVITDIAAWIALLK